jgi:hypothetical protein
VYSWVGEGLLQEWTGNFVNFNFNVDNGKVNDIQEGQGQEGQEGQVGQQGQQGQQVQGHRAQEGLGTFSPTYEGVGARYVPVPTMSSLCKHLLHSEHITAHYGTKIHARPIPTPTRLRPTATMSMHNVPTVHKDSGSASAPGSGSGSDTSLGLGLGRGLSESKKWSILDAATGVSLKEVDWLLATDR